ncbi:MAG: hypothetical protein ABF306_07025 [Nocardioides marinisabuli]|uniref:hypothetical protein n=1 Tax=Nocardioides marinisabuli TaxID=419476 RepID=UPI003219FCE9
MTGRAGHLWVPLVALLAMLASGTYLVTQDRGPGAWFDGWGHSGVPMMGGYAGPGWSDGDGRRVDDLDEARDRAQAFAERLGPGLRVGEVMHFDENFYAELEEADGTLATEVLVDPSSGATRLEFGPAMMWNTRYGMMARPGAPVRVDAAEARDIAAQWADDRDGLDVGEAEPFPGYYTLHTLRDDEVDGMLSVNATTGAVWYHGWHGDFIAMSDEE